MRISSTPAISGHTKVFPVSLANSEVIAMTKHIAWEFIESISEPMFLVCGKHHGSKLQFNVCRRKSKGS